MSASPLQDRLVFVVGAPRSGTTWLQRVLSTHPDVLVLPSETHLFSYGLSTLRDRTQSAVVGGPSTATWFMPPEEFADAARQFADAALGSYVRRTRPDALRVVERSPTHVWHLGLIADVYPDAWVLHIVRDGRDVVRSQVSQTWGAAEIPQAAAEWAGAVRAARAASPRLHRYLEVRYEELLADPSGIAPLFAHLGLDASPEVLSQAALESGRAVNVDPTRPDVATGKWQREWAPEDVAAFEDVAGDALDLLGYPRLPAVGGVATGADRARPGKARWKRPRVFRPDLERRQETVTAVLGALSASGQGLVDLLDDSSLSVSAWSGPLTWRALGRPAAERLAAQVAEEGPWGDPVSGEQVVAGETWTVVLVHRDAAGEVVSRVVVLTVGESGCTSVRYFRLPYGAETS